MSLPSATIQNEIADKNESITQSEFERRGYIVTKLDKGNSRKRPDFLIVKGSKQVIVEVKTMLSAGRTKHNERQKAGIALSSLDNETYGKVVSFSDDDPIRKLKEIFGNAAQKFKEMTQDDSTKLGVPYVICIFDQLAFCPTSALLQGGFFGLDDISAVLLPKKDSLGLFEWETINNSQAHVHAEASLFAF